MQEHMSESEEQSLLFDMTALFSRKYPDLNLLFHIPNGGKRDIRTAVKLRAEGVKPGVPDLFLPVARGKYHGLFVELKVGKNKTSKYQDEWLAKLTEQGYKAIVCYSADKAFTVIEAYLNLDKNREAK